MTYTYTYTYTHGLLNSFHLLSCLSIGSSDLDTYLLAQIVYLSLLQNENDEEIYSRTHTRSLIRKCRTRHIFQDQERVAGMNGYYIGDHLSINDNRY